MKPIDYTSLQSPVTKQDSDLFLSSTPNATSARGDSSAVRVVAVLFFGFFALTGIPIIFFMILLSSPSIVSAIIALVVSMMLFTGIVAGTILLVRYVTKKSSQDLINAVRLQRFAQTNGFSYDAAIMAPGYTGIIFRDHDDAGISLNVLRSLERGVEIANYRWIAQDQKDATTHTWGYIRIKLDQAVPEMLLLAKQRIVGGLTMTDMSVDFATNQMVTLEGDFSDHFTLYAPKEYEVDVRYIFSPDVMAVLTDNVAMLDMQIVDDYAYIYSWQAFQLGDEAAMQRLMNIIETVGKKLVNATDRYQDDHQIVVVKSVVAPQGQRLRESKHVVRTILVSLYASVFVAVAAYIVISIKG